MSYNSSFNPYGGDDDSDEEEELDEYGNTSSSSRDGALFVIDFTPLMHVEQGPDSETPFVTSIKAVQSTLQSKIIQSETDCVGVLLFGTKQSNNSGNFEHIYLLQDLDVPDAQRILQLMSIQKKQELGSTDEFSLADIFWEASNVFANCPQKLTTKRIFLITIHDNPHAGNMQLLNMATVKARDLLDLGIQINLFSFDQVGGPLFNFEAFYKDIISPSDTDTDSLYYPSISNTSLSLQIRRKETKKRAYFKIPFILGPELSIGVIGYNLFVEMKKPTGIWLNVNNKEVKPETRYVCSDTGTVLLKTDMKYWFPYGAGGDKAIFTPEELDSIKSFSTPSILLLGFKPSSFIRIIDNVSHSIFIYPDEATYSGSTSLFAHLLDRCIALDKVMICRMISRKNAQPKIVALLPQQEVDGEAGQEFPPGFHVIILPYADDIRPLDLVPPMEAVPDDALNLMTSIIKKLSLKKYHPSNYENPGIQKHYANIQALALKKDMVDEVVDQTLPKTEEVEKRVGMLIEAMNELTGVEVVKSTSKAGKARKTEDDGDGAGTSRAKKVKSETAVDEVYIRKLVDEGKLTSLTIPILTEFAKSVGMKGIKKKKGDLVEQIENCQIPSTAKKYFVKTESGSLQSVESLQAALELLPDRHEYDLILESSPEKEELFTRIIKKDELKLKKKEKKASEKSDKPATKTGEVEIKSIIDQHDLKVKVEGVLRLLEKKSTRNVQITVVDYEKPSTGVKFKNTVKAVKELMKENDAKMEREEEKKGNRKEWVASYTKKKVAS